MERSPLFGVLKTRDAFIIIIIIFIDGDTSNF